MFKVPNEYRIKNHPLLGSDDSDGNCGAFLIPNQTEGGYGEFVVIASDGYGWEHISARLVCENQSLTPDWDEMCYLKSIFWDDDDTVVQYHPKKSDYINHHPNVLHLWRKPDFEFPLPPKNLV